MIKSATSFPMHNVQLSNGSNMAYIDEGTGEKVLVFIHGLANYSLGWKKNIDYLRQYYRCIAVDLPGNGFSGRGDFSYGIDFYSRSIRELVAKLGLSNVCLVGHSMGGQIAMNLAISRLFNIRKLVLCAPAGFETFTALERIMFRSGISLFDLVSSEEDSLSRTIQNSFYHNNNFGADMIKDLSAFINAHPIKMYRQMVEASIHGMLDEPVYDQLHLIEQPTLVLFGENDKLIPNVFIHPTETTRHIAENGTKRMPHAVLKMFPKCGHFLQIEKADEVNLAIQKFMDA